MLNINEILKEIGNTNVKKDRDFVTITLMNKAGHSLNNGEGNSNGSEVNTRDINGKKHVVVHNQAIKHSMDEVGLNLYGDIWDIGKHLTEDNKVIQIKADSTISNCIPIDYRGYMKTVKKEGSKIRTAVREVSEMISVRPFKNNIDFCTNKGYVDSLNRYNKKELNCNPYSEEQVNDYFIFTYSLELSRLGIDENDNIKLDNKERVKRALMDLNILRNLKRKLKGVSDDLSPVFCIGGVYSNHVPYFQNSIKIDDEGNLKIDIIKETMNRKINGFSEDKIESNCKIACNKGIFTNEEEVMKNLSPVSVDDFFEHICNEVFEYYNKEKQGE